MSKKNVISDYQCKGLVGSTAQTATAANDVDTVEPLLSFAAKKNGYMRIDCVFAVEDTTDTQFCIVSVAESRTATALGKLIPYTAQPAMVEDGFGMGHYVIAVAAGQLYDVIGTSTSGVAIVSGIVSIQYL